MKLIAKEKAVQVRLTKEEKIALLMAQDIIVLKQCLNKEIYSFAVDILKGNHHQYSKMSNKEISYKLEDRQRELYPSVFSLAEKLLDKPDGYFTNKFTFKK